MRLEDMPDVEALEELRIRRASALVELERLRGEDSDKFVPSHGVRISQLCALISLIKDDMKKRNVRLDNSNWREAVKAVFGEEGFQQCLLWKAHKNGR